MGRKVIPDEELDYEDGTITSKILKLQFWMLEAMGMRGKRNALEFSTGVAEESGGNVVGGKDLASGDSNVDGKRLDVDSGGSASV